MGQDVATSFAILIAEELEAPLALLKVEFAKASKDIPNQMTVGSSSMRSWWVPMRRIGASAKQLLLTQASHQLDVHESQLHASEGVIEHRESKQKVSYSELLKDINFKTITQTIELKQPESYSLIGKDTRSLLNYEKVTGTLPFVTDASPAGTPVTDNSLATTAFRIVSIAYKDPASVPLKHQLNEIVSNFKLSKAVVINGEAPYAKKVILCHPKTWPLLKAKATLENLKRTHAKQSAMGKQRSFQQTEKRLHEENLVNKTHISLCFQTPAIAQAPMEPEAARAEYKDNSIQLWVPTQAPDIARKSAAQALNISLDKVELTTTPIGGGFGRKRYSDYVVELALAAQALFIAGTKGSVTLQWTREDDLERERYRPPTLQQVVWNKSEPDNFLIRLHEGYFGANESNISTFTHETMLSSQFRVNKQPLADQFVTGIWRSVDHGYIALAICSSIDEMCRQTKQDPIDYYLSHIQSAPIKSRIKSVLNFDRETDEERFRNSIISVRKFANLDLPEKDSEGIGFAAYSCFGSHIAMIAKVAIVENRLKIKHIWAAIDCGQPIHPDGVKAQIEGGILYGLSACLHSEIPTEKDALALNFDQYKVLRFDETPRISVTVIESTMPPSGVGELGVPPIAPAICNAIRSLTPFRFNKLPILKGTHLNYDNAFHVLDSKTA